MLLLCIGLVFILAGFILLLFYKQLKSSMIMRFSLTCFAIGTFHLLILAGGVFVPILKTHGIIICLVYLILSLGLQLLEFNQSYRQFRDLQE